jgi:hypothetical protein
METAGPVNGALKIGNAGEHLVCFECWDAGHPAYLVPQQAPHDILLQGRDNDWLMVQVKTVTSTPKLRPNLYQWVILKGKSKSPYEDTLIDIFAFAALEIPIVIFMAYKDIKTDFKVTVSKKNLYKYTLNTALDNFYDK